MQYLTPAVENISTLKAHCSKCNWNCGVLIDSYCMCDQEVALEMPQGCALNGAGELKLTLFANQIPVRIHCMSRAAQ